MVLLHADSKGVIAEPVDKEGALCETYVTLNFLDALKASTRS